MTTLGDYCDITMGQAPSGESYNTDAIGLPLIAGAGDFSSGKISVKKFTSDPTKISEAGAIVMSIRASIGDKVWADRDYCLGRGVVGLRPSPELASNYLWHWLTSTETALRAKGKGATFLQVSRRDIAELPMQLPQIEEQRRIADILDKADALRAKRREAIDHLDTLSQNIFYDLFGDPVTNGRGWLTKRLNELGTLDRGVSSHRPRNDPVLLGGEYPLIQTGDVAKSGGRIEQYGSTYSPLGLAQSKMWPAGTLCITIAANIAKTGILMFDACFPDSVVGFTADISRVKFVQQWFGFFQKHIEAKAPESAQKNINLAVLRHLEVIDPPWKLVEVFASQMEAVDHLKSMHRRQLANLDSFFHSLQDRAFKGEL